VTMMIVSLARAHRQAYWPRPLPPMLPSPAPPFHRPGWVYEEKYDGWRCLAYKRGGEVRLLSRHGIDYTGRFRALAAAIALLPASTLLLDGEVTAFDEHLLSRRAFLHPDPDALVTPPIYIAFDCLLASGRDLRDHPLGARREVLERLIENQSLLFPARRLSAYGLAAWAEVQRRGYEGLVAKDESSAYRSGRTRAGSAPTKDHLLVFFLPTESEWEENCKRMVKAGFRAVPSSNPYWDRKGRTFEDVDGYRVVLQNDAWSG
jgi:bifunctional non-homologous end joining protein LigD